MGKPTAYLLTWTCYATWLHGDPRGSVDDDHNVYGTLHLAPDVIRETREARAAGPALLMDPRAREVVETTIADHCRIRGWPLHAVNARSNHVHTVVSCPCEPERALLELKAWCTRKLRAERLAGPRDRVWTHHGSTRYLWDAHSLARAIDYVLNHQ